MVYELAKSSAIMIVLLVCLSFCADLMDAWRSAVAFTQKTNHLHLQSINSSSALDVNASGATPKYPQSNLLVSYLKNTDWSNHVVKGLGESLMETMGMNPTWLLWARRAFGIVKSAIDHLRGFPTLNQLMDELNKQLRLLEGHASISREPLSHSEGLMRYSRWTFPSNSEELVWENQHVTEPSNMYPVNLQSLNSTEVQKVQDVTFTMPDGTTKMVDVVSPKDVFEDPEDKLELFHSNEDTVFVVSVDGQFVFAISVMTMLTQPFSRDGDFMYVAPGFRHHPHKLSVIAVYVQGDPVRTLEPMSILTGKADFLVCPWVHETNRDQLPPIVPGPSPKAAGFNSGLSYESRLRAADWCHHRVWSS